MTCIVGLMDTGRVYIGGDSAGVGGLDLIIRSDPKVFRNGEFIFGFTSSFRMGQLLRFSFKAPPRPEGVDDYQFLVTSFINSIRTCLKEGGFAASKDGVESGGSFLLGYRGNLYNISGDYQVGIAADGFDSCGCGQQIALGSLFSTKGQSPETRIDLALKAAENYSAGVRGPFTVINL